MPAPARRAGVWRTFWLALALLRASAAVNRSASYNVKGYFRGPPPTALLLVGAAYDVGGDVIRRYRLNAVAPLGAKTVVFAYLKAVHFDGTLYNDADALKLESSFRTLLDPAAFVLARNSSDAKFDQASAKATDCLWRVPKNATMRPNERAHFAYLTPRQLGSYKQVLAKWWGAMQDGWGLVSAYEEKRGYEFDRVVVMRIGLDLKRPLPGFRSYERRTFYTMMVVPDALWVMPRWVARNALRTLSGAAKCALDEECCVSMRKSQCHFKVSFFLPCYWARRLGVKIVFAKVDAVLRTHKAGTAVTATYQARDAVERTTSGNCHPWDQKDKLRKLPWQSCGDLLEPERRRLKHDV
ncbi:hypothetical protein M885DRAFT_524832 [Pelagophyceae sp. CCMP2097]|nr:hypothetical protein M885DRAFT_524832 [Pelagophyceae sp. CCMP2097]|mmetsp:Transcript_107/g.396  ORF Transcript_107/g.396 Transcript_107/m.396 type:complete len:354 (-) Transcript_107:11-1072(-)